MDFDGVKVFSASRLDERGRLGEAITEWRARNPGITIVDTRVTQSSDNAFHCLSITMLFVKKK